MITHPARRGRHTVALATALTLLASLLVALLPATPVLAADKPLLSTPLFSWNMRGGTASAPNSSKWPDYVARYARLVPIMMLQEAGSGPPGSAEAQPGIVRTTVDSQGAIHTHTVQHSIWTPGSTRYRRHVYFLLTQNGQGGRVNLAMVLQDEPDEVNVVQNPVDAGRTALGVRYGAHWYFTVHGLSGGGGDSAVLLGAIGNAVNTWAQDRNVQYNWTVGGDFNVDPDTLAGRAGYPTGALRITTPAGVPTHDNGGRLDYFVTDDAQAVQNGVQQASVYNHDDQVPDSDHRVVYARQRLPGLVPESTRLMPLGDSITQGLNSSDSSGARDEIQHDVGMITLEDLGLGGAALPWSPIAKRDLVGERCTGVGIPDRDHEGWPGYTIDQIRQEASDAVPGMRPNIVTLMAGTNDMVRDVDVADAPARLSAFIDQIFAGSPGVAIVVSLLTPSADPAIQARISAYNAAIAPMIDQRTARGDRVLLVEPALTLADLDDVVHPNDGGYRKLADAFGPGIKNVLALGWVQEPGPMTMTSLCSERNGYAPQGVIAAGLPGNPDLADALKFADLDGDGKDDYVWLSPTGAATVWLNRGGDGPGGGGWVYRAEIAQGAGTAPDRVFFADMDGDGKDDYVVVREDNGIDVYLNRGGDTTDASGWHQGWEPRPNYGLGTPVHLDKIRFADLDGDRRADYVRLVDFNQYVDVWYNRGGDSPGHNGWQEGGRILTDLPARANAQIEFADLDADGLADYIALDPDGVPRAWLNTGTPTWTDRGQIATGTGGRVALPEIDGDGRADWVQIASNGALTAWLNRGGD
ncbi:lysophospholipase L1-like esterase [Actinocorallia herbida]|uniref:Lysophospholipase L1-like esterase n=1 Tax=Actinocorallia herbida TaxID=58109 RepID=A0A3N1D1B8_9ACTN|nr:FG-GAP-like repeat-containing protein [Actinocorallia herbida]ROO87306.1 lysophospholipase L1-like esterase [Actinocorallia herbida]